MKRLPRKLYHGTLLVNAESIVHGVSPRIPKEYTEYEEAGAARPYVFATESPVVALGRIQDWVSTTSDWFNPSRVPWKWLEDHGALAIFENLQPYHGWKFCSEMESWKGDCPPTVEPRDWYTPYEVVPTRVLTGKALVALARRTMRR